LQSDYKMKHLTLLLAGILAGFSLSAQRSIEVGAIGGTTYYIGEMNSFLPFLYSKPAYGGVYRYNYSDRLAFRLHAFKGELKGDDSFWPSNQWRGLNFNSTLIEAGGQFEVNFYDFFIGSKRDFWTPYIFGGVSYFYFKPYGNVQGSLVELRTLGTEGQNSGVKRSYFYNQVSIPFGMGIKLSLNKLFGMGFEWGLRKTFTDYLDDVSGKYYMNLQGSTTATLDQLASDPALNHNAGMQRGNPGDKDWYAFAAVSLVVKIKMLRKEKCLDHQREGY
jgi:hypothetical protein